MKPFIKLTAFVYFFFAFAGTATAGDRPLSADTLVHYSTGINPQDYPCAREGIMSLYEKRAQVSDLGRFHPKRVFAWVVDTTTYFAMRIVDFFKGLMNPGALKRGFHEIQAMARSNPLAGMDNKVEGWMENLSPKGQFVMERKVQGIIRNTTNDDGSCKN